MKGNVVMHVVLEEMLPTEAKNVQLYMRFSEQFGGANTTLIEIKNKKGSIYSKEFLEKYKKVAEDVYYRPDGIRHLNQSLAVARQIQKARATQGYALDDTKIAVVDVHFRKGFSRTVLSICARFATWRSRYGAVNCTRSPTANARSASR